LIEISEALNDGTDYTSWEMEHERSGSDIVSIRGRLILYNGNDISRRSSEITVKAETKGGSEYNNNLAYLKLFIFCICNLKLPIDFNHRKIGTPGSAPLIKDWSERLRELGVVPEDLFEQRNIAGIRRILAKVGVDCMELEAMVKKQLKRKVLTTQLVLGFIYGSDVVDAYFDGQGKRRKKVLAKRIAPSAQPMPTLPRADMPMKNNPLSRQSEIIAVLIEHGITADNFATKLPLAEAKYQRFTNFVSRVQEDEFKDLMRSATTNK